MNDAERNQKVARRLFAAAVMIEQALEQVNAAVDMMQGGKPVAAVMIGQALEQVNAAVDMMQGGEPVAAIPRQPVAKAAAAPEEDEVAVNPEPTFEDQPNAPKCVAPDGHTWVRYRRGGDVALDGCRWCPAKRWIPSPAFVEGSGAKWNFGPPPAPRAARIMGPDDKLEEGEEWEDADGAVPHNITKGAPGAPRNVDGRTIEGD